MWSQGAGLPKRLKLGKPACMLRLVALLLLACTPLPHAEAYVKKNFGFIGDREITVVGPDSDTNRLRLELQKFGFRVLEVEGLPEAQTRYAADVSGLCGWGLVNFSETAYPDAELHVFVVKTETRERVLSIRLRNRDDCPNAFFEEAAAAIARHWAREETAAQ
jgi:hypothetical protein